MDTAVLGTAERTETAPHDYEALASASLKLFLWINLVIPAAVFGAVYLLRQQEVIPDVSLMTEATLQLVTFALLFASVAEFGAGFVVRKTMFSPAKIQPVRVSIEGFSKQVRGASIVLAALGASPMFYGVVQYVLGADLRYIAAFGLLTLLAFRLHRPTAEFLRSSIARAELEEPSK